MRIPSGIGAHTHPGPSAKRPVSSTFAVLTRSILILSGEPVEEGDGTESTNPISSPVATSAPDLARISSSPHRLRVGVPIPGVRNQSWPLWTEWLPI